MLVKFINSCLQHNIIYCLLFQTQTDAIENIDIKTVDLVALNSCLERGLQFLKTEYNCWPKMIDYLETSPEHNINDDKTIKVSIRTHPSFGMVITSYFLNIVFCNG